VVLRQVDEAEGLQPSLGSPHGEHHFGVFADGGLSEMEDDLDSQLLVEGLLHVHQSAGGGDLMKFAAYFAPVGQAN